MLFADCSLAETRFTLMVEGAPNLVASFNVVTIYRIRGKSSTLPKPLARKAVATNATSGTSII